MHGYGLREDPYCRQFSQSGANSVVVVVGIVVVEITGGIDVAHVVAVVRVGRTFNPVPGVILFEKTLLHSTVLREAVLLFGYTDPLSIGFDPPP